MKFIAIFFIFLNPAHASEPIAPGVYSLATEADWGASFELLKNGTAIVKPKHENDRDDDALITSKTIPISGKWKPTPHGIEISYLKERDQLKFEKNCREWKKYSCFYFEKSLLNQKNGSSLNFKMPFVNWDSTISK